MIVAAHTGVDELDDDLLSDTFKIAIPPSLERICGSLTTALFHRTIVGAAAGMRLDFIRLAVHDVHATAISFPSGNTGGKVFVRVSNALVMLFLEFVLYGIRRWIAARPKCFDEIVALLIVRKLLEGGSLFVGDDVANIFVQPLLVDVVDLFLEPLLLLLFFFVSKLPIAFVIGRRVRILRTRLGSGRLL